MHLPYSSVFASFAVQDARGGLATRDYDGAIQVQSPPRSADAAQQLKRRATAVHSVDSSIHTVNGSHRPRRAATTTSLLASRSSAQIFGLSRQHSCTLW